MTRGIRGHKAGLRLIAAAAFALVTLVLFVGCITPTSATRNHGWATVRFDGTPLGVSNNLGPGIDCSRESDTGGATLIESSYRWFGPDIIGDWRPRGGGPKASLRLEMAPNPRTAASVEFSIGSALYRSSTPTQVEPGWRRGRTVFKDVPLVSGEAYEGKSTLKHLVVEWACANYPPGA